MALALAGIKRVWETYLVEYKIPVENLLIGFGVILVRPLSHFIIFSLDSLWHLRGTDLIEWYCIM
jgi:hypothetical protein